MRPDPDQPGREPLTPTEAEFVQQILSMYRAAIFPMAESSEGPIQWWALARRGIMPLTEDEGFHVPQRLERTIRRRPFWLTIDRAFDRVVAACAAPRRPRPGSRSVSDETWISTELADCYSLLHRAGHAHSIEAWLVPEGGPTPPAGPVGRPPPEGAVLVGGLFGIRIAGFFAGESMFSRLDLGGTDASKVCLVQMVRLLRSRGFTLFDVQCSNPHLEQFGCLEIDARDYTQRLRQALSSECHAPLRAGPGPG